MPRPHDLKPGGGYGTLKPDPVVKTKTGYRLAQFFDIDDDLSDIDDELDDDLKVDINNKMGIASNNKVHYDRVDRASLVSNQRFMPEIATHTNTARPGMSPFKYPAPMAQIGGGGANQAFKTTGSPKRTGTLNGFAHAPINTDNLGTPGIVEDPMWRSFLAQQRKLRKIFKKIRNSLG